jgi:hypothetical protein
MFLGQGRPHQTEIKETLQYPAHDHVILVVVDLLPHRQDLSFNEGPYHLQNQPILIRQEDVRDIHYRLLLRWSNRGP